MKHEIRHIDVCLPSFFQGSGNPVIAIPVDGEATYQDIADEIWEEYMGDCGMYPEMDMTTAMSDLFEPVKDKMQDIAFPDLEVIDPDDGGDMVYAYFDIIETE